VVNSPCSRSIYRTPTTNNTPYYHAGRRTLWGNHATTTPCQLTLSTTVFTPLRSSVRHYTSGNTVAAPSVTLILPPSSVKCARAARKYWPAAVLCWLAHVTPRLWRPPLRRLNYHHATVYAIINRGSAVCKTSPLLNNARIPRHTITASFVNKIISHHAYHHGPYQYQNNYRFPTIHHASRHFGYLGQPDHITPVTPRHGVSLHVSHRVGRHCHARAYLRPVSQHYYAYMSRRCAVYASLRHHGNTPSSPLPLIFAIMNAAKVMRYVPWLLLVQVNARREHGFRARRSPSINHQ